ncbi:MAG: 16S rRNA (adenine(1518)-N(6)/adenine(1519)-N(6))-dimethyltransferase RsmA [Stellaceae bacterium]
MNPDLPPLGEVIRRHHLSALKSLGQHFLLDANLTARIARAAGALDDCAIVEIGPGPGGLTRALLLAGAKHVTAVERDPRAVAALDELSAAFPGRLTIVEGDALEIDAAALTPPPRKIVANLPYNIATPLLIGWLENISAYQSLTLMFQKEVAQRLVAAPGGKDYGRLSVMTQWSAAPRLLFDISPKAFTPPPKVTSTLVEIVPRPAPNGACSRADLERVVAAAFGQRRKMLRAALKSLGVDANLLLERAGIEPTERAERLTVAQFAALARRYAGISRP